MNTSAGHLHLKRHRKNEEFPLCLWVQYNIRLISPNGQLITMLSRIGHNGTKVPSSDLQVSSVVESGGGWLLQWRAGRTTSCHILFHSEQRRRNYCLCGASEWTTDRHQTRNHWKKRQNATQYFNCYSTSGLLFGMFKMWDQKLVINWNRHWTELMLRLLFGTTFGRIELKHPVWDLCWNSCSWSIDMNLLYRRHSSQKLTLRGWGITSPIRHNDGVTPWTNRFYILIYF